MSALIEHLIDPSGKNTCQKTGVFGLPLKRFLKQNVPLCGLSNQFFQNVPDAMSSKNLFFVAAKLVASGLLVVAAFLRYPYDYYTLMRWVVCIVSAFGMLHAISIARHRWAWTLGITGVFFNPVFPVHLKREVWSCVDVVAAGVITVSIHLNFQKK